MKITFTDTKTNKVLAEDTFADAEVKALNTELSLANFKNEVIGVNTTGIGAWVLNVLKAKASACINDIVEKSGKGSRHTPTLEKHKIIDDLAKANSPLLETATAKQAKIDKAI